MGKRREARETALQILVARDLNHDFAEEEQDVFWELLECSSAARTMGETLVTNLEPHRTEIDRRLDDVTQNYDIERLSTVDRNILRIAIYEMFHRLDTPPIVSINEAIEIAKRFGTEESGRFVNGVLDRLKEQLDRPLREASPSPGS
ncbi:MAG: transcription antitermination factor NusB [Verrucomicrobiota bacterium]